MVVSAGTAGGQVRRDGYRSAGSGEETGIRRSPGTARAARGRDAKDRAGGRPPNGPLAAGPLRRGRRFVHAQGRFPIRLSQRSHGLCETGWTWASCLDAY